ncbi:MAG: CHAD domain-containing protein [Elusimicrobia bacterium]|nr:CHAD domain-containing protein [Elusimicrobiota bacterium]
MKGGPPRRRLDGGADPEALHDFRVGLRRLRVCLRFYRAALAGLAPGKAARRTRKIAESTGEARDTEVFEEWLGLLEKSLKPAHKPGVEAFRRRLSERRQASRQGLVSQARRDFAALDQGLRAAIAADLAGPRGAAPGQRRTAPAAPSRTFGAFSASLLRQVALKVKRRLRGFKTAQEDEPLHRARIAAKQLRYLLEPFRWRCAGSRKAIARLKRLQDCLGAVHDLNLMISALGRCAKKEVGAWSRRLVESASGGPARPGRPSHSAGNPAPGLVKLAELAGRRRAKLFDRYRHSWEGGRTDKFFADIEAAAARLAARPADAAPDAKPVEPDRASEPAPSGPPGPPGSGERETSAPAPGSPAT